ncbi:LamG-like jellyroll fold domain-containing protein [Fodinicola acaciae]|uniref:LamG-like jellyroll fold domain-containing protein n=1 Tax=Fodinicola acaciae TaxID=2681555 RepID=UPI0013D6ADB3|nr:LamG-like jellyroll fold domain-containing protein [Fodinicola acaciae]
MLILTFLVTFSWEPATAFAGPVFQLPDLSAALHFLAGDPSAKWGPVPVQPTGTAAGKAHLVPASATKAAGGNGRRPGRGRGELPAYARPGKPTPSGPSGKASARFDAKTSQRVAAKSTATSTYFQNADGSYTRRLSQTPVNYRDSSGTWQPIDTSLTAAGGRWREKANAISVDLASTATDPGLARIGLNGKGLSYGLRGAASVRPQVSGSTATYLNVLPDTDLQLHPVASGLKESVVLHAATAASSWVFPLHLDGLTASQRPDGSIVLNDSSGKAMGRLVTPYAFDSKVDPHSGDPATTHAVTSRLTTTADGQQAIEVSLDRSWLTDTKRVFPVTVDPSYNMSFSGAESTYADTDTPAVDHSDELVVKVGSFNAGSANPYKANSFVRFYTGDLTGSQVSVSSATLHVFDTWAYDCNPHPFSIAQVTQAWNGGTAGAYPGPSVGGAVGGATPTVPHACANTAADRTVGDWVAAPVSAGVITAWAASGEPDNGLSLYASTTDKTAWKQFDSVNSDFPPYLEITYTGTLNPQVFSWSPPTGSSVTTLTPALAATGEVSPALGVNPKFRFQVFNSNSTLIADSNVLTTNRWAVPAGKLAWGQTYYWQAQTFDGTRYSAPGIWQTFTVQVPQPLVTSALAQNQGGRGYSPNNGNYTTSATDAQVTSVGPELAVRRDYNSRDPRLSGAFGGAWSSVFDARAVEQHDATNALASVDVTYPEGSTVGFGRNGDGTFSPPSGRFATFTAITGGGYKLIDKDNTAYTFTQALGGGAYGLTSIADANNRTVTYAWSGGHVATATSTASGRALHLAWTTPAGASNPHVSTVTTDPTTAGDNSTIQTWAYSYSGDQLTQVCSPVDTNGCTRYGYQTASQYHNQVLDIGAQSFWPLAETSGTTAASAVVANEGNDNGTYNNVTLGQPGPLAGGSATAASFNGTSSYVELPNQHLYTTPALSVSLWFKTAKPLGVLFSASDQLITNTATAGNFAPALYIGNDGKLIGRFWEGLSNTAITTPTAVTDNNWHHVVLTGSLTAQTLWLDNTQIGSTAGLDPQSGSGVTPHFLKHSYIGAGYLGGTWPDQPHQDDGKYGAYYFNGSIADVGLYAQTLSPQIITGLYQTGLNPVSLLTSITRPSGNTDASVSYDPVTATVTSVTDDKGGTWKIAPPVVTGSSNVYRSAVLGSSPATYHRLGEAAGGSTAVDELNSGDASYHNVTLGGAGPFSDKTAAGFDGTSSFVQLPATDNVQTGPGSVELWFRMATNSTAGGVLFDEQSLDITTITTAQGNYVPAMYVGTDGKLYGKFWDTNHTSGGMVSPTRVNDGLWHHAALAAAANGQVLYLDGQKIGATTAALVASPSNFVYVGAGASGFTWPNHPTNTLGWFPGSISDVAFYRTQVSSQEISNHYSAGRHSGGPSPVQTVTVTDPGGRPQISQYDIANGMRLIAESDGTGRTTTYGYDTGGFAHTITDPNGNVTILGHDVRGNEVSHTTCQNQAAQVCSTTYTTHLPDNTSSKLTPSPTNDLQATVRDGRSASATDNTYLTSYGYDAAGNRTTVTTPPVDGYPSGRTTTISYTDGTTVAAADSGFAPAGLPYKTVSPAGATTLVSYFHNGDIASVTDPAGMVTSFTYDGLGRMLTKKEVSDTYPAGLVTAYAYNGIGQVVTQDDPPTTNRVTGAIHSPRITTVYAPDGQMASQTTADRTGGDAPRTVQATYDDHGQVRTNVDALNKTTTFGYDLYGHKTSETDPNGVTTAYTYDAAGRLLTQVLKGFTGDPNNPSPAADLVESSRAYDPAGQLASVTDAMGNSTNYTYTDNGLVATITKRDPTGTKSFVLQANTYDAAGNPIRQVTNNGATTAASVLDAADRVTSTTVDPTGVNRTTTITYDPDDRPLKSVVQGDPVTPPASPTTGPTITRAATHAAAGTAPRSLVPGISTTMTYDPLGRVTSRAVADDQGHSSKVSWTLDRRGLPTTMTDADNNVTSYAYDEAGRLTTTTAPTVNVETGGAAATPAHPVTTTGYDTFGGPTENEDPNGNVTTTAYDADGQKASVTQPSYTPPGSDSPITPVARWTYDDAGNILTATDPLNHITRYGYDQIGDTTSITDPRGGISRTSFDTNGQALQTTSPGGAVKSATYDYLGRQVTATVLERYPTPATLTSTSSYEASATNPGGAFLASTTTPAGARTSYGYNAVGETISTTDPSGATTHAEYDGFGRTIATTLADGRSTRTSYDHLGDPLQVQQLDTDNTVLTTTSATYNGSGHLTSTTDARGHTSQFTIDPSGLVTQEIQPVDANTSITTTFGYDAAGHRTRFTDGRGNSWLYTYNSLNLPASTIEPATTTYTSAADRTTTTSYDANGRVTRRVAPGGVSVAGSYDDNGNLTGQTGNRAEAVTADRSFTYDPDGRMLTANTAAAGDQGPTGPAVPATNTTFTYNDRGDLLTATGTGGASSFTYNTDGLLTTRTDAAGTATYGYDNADRVSAITDPITGTQLSIAYNTLSQPATIHYGQTGDVRTFGYDHLHRLATDTLTTSTSAASATVASISYGYDENGNLTSKNTTGFGAAGTTANNTYTYDDANRLTSWNNGTTTTPYEYDASGNRTRVGANVYTYNARDELTSDGNISYTYSARGTLTKQTNSAGTATSTTDAYGQQATQGVIGGTTQTYLSDALGRVVHSQATDGTTRTFAFSGAGNDLASDGAHTYSRGPDGSLLAIGTPTTPHNPTSSSRVVGARAPDNNASGSSGGVLAFTDAHDDVVGNFTADSAALTGNSVYDPLGNITASTGMAGNLGFQSGWTDTTTGKVNMATRWYNPATGSFMNKDSVALNPVPQSVSANPFAYVNDNPLAGNDPTGQCSWWDLVCGAKAVVSTGVHLYNRYVAPVVNYVYNNYIKPAANFLYNHLVRPIVNYAVHTYNSVSHFINDAYNQAKRAAARAKQLALEAAARVKRIAIETYQRARAQAAKAATVLAHAAQTVGTFIKAHAATIASVVASTVVFAGCEAVLGAMTGGVGAIPGAILCGGISGAVGGLVEQGVNCMQGQKGGCSGAAFGKAALMGGLTGAIGGVAGALGGKLASAVLGKVLPKLVTEVVGGAAGGAAGGATTSAVSYGMGCRESAAGCTWSGLGHAALSGAETGAAFGAAGAAGSRLGQAFRTFRTTRNAPKESTPAPTTEPAPPESAPNKPARSEESTGCPHSFVASTPVLMANGSTKPIADIKAGDKITNAVPGSSKTQTHTVGHVIITTTDHDFVNLTIATLDNTGHPAAVATITTTAHHPFYDTTHNAFIDAAQLHEGDHLQTTTNTAVVLAVNRHHGTATTYDLTIPDLHTYYVLVGSAAALVHNCDDPRVFENTIPSDRPGFAKTFTPKTLQRRSGKFGYVVKQDGQLLLGRLTDGHVSIAGGDAVMAAGEVHLRSGRILEINNASGHYRPYGQYQQSAAESAFRDAGWEVTNQYVERWPGAE